LVATGSGTNQLPLNWVLADKKYTCYQGGKPIGAPQEKPPVNVNIWDRANLRTLRYNGTAFIVVTPR
jgi:hypothetical protein